MARDAHASGADDINAAAVDRLVTRVQAARPKAKVRSAFSGTSGLAPTMVAVVAAIPTTLVVILSVVLGRPLLLVAAVAAMVVTMVVVMTRVNRTRVVAELPGELVVLDSRRGVLTELTRLPKSLAVEPGGGRAWVHVLVGDERLWVSRPAFGGIVDRFVDPSAGADVEPSPGRSGGSGGPRPDDSRP